MNTKLKAILVQFSLFSLTSIALISLVLASTLSLIFLTLISPIYEIIKHTKEINFTPIHVIIRQYTF